MPHITIEYSSNIADKLAVTELLRKLHNDVINHNIEAYKIKSRAVLLADYIIGDEQTHTSMAHVTCLLLAGRPSHFAEKLSKDLFAILQSHIEAKGIAKCSASVEVRDMNPETYSK